MFISFLFYSLGCSSTPKNNSNTDTGSLQVDSGESQCSEFGDLSLEAEISWKHWGGGPLPLVSFTPDVTTPPCNRFVAGTTLTGLEITVEEDGSSIQVTLNPDTIISGNQSGTIAIWDEAFEEVLVEIPVSLSALVHPADPYPPRRALVIGVDGLDGAEMHTADLPNIEFLQEGGRWSRSAHTQMTGPTSSGPGWTSFLSGVEVVDHGITSNGGYDERDISYPSFLYKLKEVGFQTAGSIQWGDIFSILEDDALSDSFGGSQTEVSDWVVDRINTEEDDIIFVHLDDLDHAGHATGFTTESESYVQTLEEIDLEVGRYINAILNGPNIAQESWLIILSSDHGGDIYGTHGTMNEDYQQIPLIMASPILPKEELDDNVASHLDIHPTIMDFFGLIYSVHMDGVSWLENHEFDCTDSIDNDEDGLVDCSDSDCTNEPNCIENECNDGIDNDENGDTDCEDINCQSNLACITCDPNDLGSAVGTEVVTGFYPSGNLLSGSCGGNTGDEEVFQWTAPTTGTFVMDTMNWYRNTVLYAFDSVCEGAELACNTEPSSSVRSVISVEVEMGQPITVVVDTNGADGAETGLSIYPQSDSCSNSSQIDDNWSSDFTHQDTAFAGSCVPMIAPLWWEWTAPSSGNYLIETNGSNFDTVLYVRDGCEGSELLCNDDSDGLNAGGSLSLTAGQSIVIGIGSFAGRTSTGTIGASITEAK